jgi:hypothetical protein
VARPLRCCLRRPRRIRHGHATRPHPGPARLSSIGPARLRPTSKIVCPLHAASGHIFQPPGESLDSSSRPASAPDHHGPARLISIGPARLRPLSRPASARD